MNKALKEQELLEDLPSCVVTRAQAKVEEERLAAGEVLPEEKPSTVLVPLDRLSLPEDQRNDPSLNCCFKALEGKVKGPPNVE